MYQIWILIKLLLITVHTAERKLICIVNNWQAGLESVGVISIERELSYCAQYLLKIFLAKIPTNPHIEASS